AQINGVKTPVRIRYRYVFKLEEAPPPPVVKTASFGGVVRDRKTKKALPGVTVGFDAETATTDAQGRFQFDDVEPGTHTVTVSGSGLTPVGTEETLVAGQKYDAIYDVEPRNDEEAGEQPVEFEIVVVDTTMSKAVVATAVTAEQGARVAGTGGDV